MQELEYNFLKMKKKLALGVVKKKVRIDENKKHNPELITIKEKSEINNNDIISKGTGIDKSTVSLHFAGKRPINVEQAYRYSHFFEVPIQRILDDNIPKYRIVGYLDQATGRVKEADKFQNIEIVICENNLIQYDDLAILSKEADMLFWFKPSINSDNVAVTPEEKYPLGRYCYVEVEQKHEKLALIGDIRKLEKNQVTVFNRHSLKEEKYKLIKAYPINTIDFMEFSDILRTESIL